MKIPTFFDGIARRSRLTIAAIGTLGSAIAANARIIFSNPTTSTCISNDRHLNPCNIEGSILTSPLPLGSAIACMVMVFLAILPLLLNSKLDRHIHSRLENWTSILLAMSGTLMFAFSGYILYTTLFELHENCNFCIGLTILSGSLFTVSLNIGGWQKLRQQLLAMMIVLMLIVVGIFGLYTIATTSRYSTQIYDRITTTSGQKEISLAQHLTKTKAKMYGAFWCGHCHEQKEMFGEAAWNQIDYIECDPKGKNSRSDICKTAKIKGFPTWEINDRLYLGKQSLDKLSELSGYRVADRPLSR